MDISTDNLFFYRDRVENIIKEKGFDSYSKSQDDILQHYFLKYAEIDKSLKAVKPICCEQWASICDSIEKEESEYEKQTNNLPPFELYIAAFLLAFRKQYRLSIAIFSQCQLLQPDSIHGQINTVFINLQIAQLYHRLKEYRKSLSLLLETRRVIHRDSKLFAIVHNFYASCCMSIGVLCHRYLNNAPIATSCFLTSILVRSKHENTYVHPVYIHYVSRAYRYIAMMHSTIPENAITFIKSACKMRQELLTIFDDDITQEEMLHFESDYIILLIRNSSKIDTINKRAKSLLQIIVNMPSQLRWKLSRYIVSIAQTLFRYYIVFGIEHKAKIWQSIAISYNSDKKS